MAPASTRLEYFLLIGILILLGLECLGHIASGYLLVMNLTQSLEWASQSDFERAQTLATTLSMVLMRLLITLAFCYFLFTNHRQARRRFLGTAALLLMISSIASEFATGGQISWEQLIHGNLLNLTNVMTYILIAVGILGLITAKVISRHAPKATPSPLDEA